ncbi:hypothetical protein SNEBB_005186 [Seison nebaliae]|nr:hypothetical protein SNEBB_005186 [Seison nebaliae]
MSDKIENYEVLSMLGRGGFACVYKAKSKATGSDVAIKMIDKKQMKLKGLVDRVRNEVEIHAQLKHPSILELYGFFEDANYVYLILELCEIGEMQKFLKERSHEPFSEDETRQFVKQIIDGMLYLHSHGILHRDLSLSNLMLNNAMNIKIGDFGLATQLSVPDEKHFTMCGTPNFISPEIVTRNAHGLEADVWSLGCMIYTMLVGKPPFDTRGVKNTLSKVAIGNYMMPMNLSNEAQSLIYMLLQKEPKDRLNLSSVLKHPFFTTYQKNLTKSCESFSILSNDRSGVFHSFTNCDERKKSSLIERRSQTQNIGSESIDDSGRSTLHNYSSSSNHMITGERTNSCTRGEDEMKLNRLNNGTNLSNCSCSASCLVNQSSLINNTSNHKHSHSQPFNCNSLSGINQTGSNNNNNNNNSTTNNSDTNVELTPTPFGNPLNYSSTSSTEHYYHQNHQTVNSLSSTTSSSNSIDNGETINQIKRLPFSTPLSKINSLSTQSLKTNNKKDGKYSNSLAELKKNSHFPTNSLSHRQSISSYTSSTSSGTSSSTSSSLSHLRPERLDASRCKPIRHKAKIVVMNINEKQEVILEFLKLSNSINYVSECLIISGDGNRILIFYPINEKSQKPPRLKEDESPKLHESFRQLVFTYTNLPKKFWKKYVCAFKFVNLVRCKTPKVTFHTNHTKTVLMDSMSEVESNFHDGIRIEISFPVKTEQQNEERRQFINYSEWNVSLINDGNGRDNRSISIKNVNYLSSNGQFVAPDADALNSEMCNQLKNYEFYYLHSIHTTAFCFNIEKSQKTLQDSLKFTMNDPLQLLQHTRLFPLVIGRKAAKQQTNKSKNNTSLMKSNENKCDNKKPPVKQKSPISPPSIIDSTQLIHLNESTVNRICTMNDVTNNLSQSANSSLMNSSTTQNHHRHQQQQQQQQCSDDKFEIFLSSFHCFASLKTNGDIFIEFLDGDEHHHRSHQHNTIMNLSTIRDIITYRHLDGNDLVERTISFQELSLMENQGDLTNISYLSNKIRCKLEMVPKIIKELLLVSEKRTTNNSNHWS